MKIEGYILIAVYFISMFLVIAFSDKTTLSGDFYYIGKTLESNVSEYSMYAYLVYIMDLLLLFLIGQVISNKNLLIDKVFNAVLFTIPVHLINAVLQFRSFIVSWGDGAVFFRASNGNIGMRLTGLFNSPFAFSSYLCILVLIILYKNMKRKYLYVSLIFIFIISSLTRSGIIIFMFILLAFLYKDRNRKDVKKMFIAMLLIFVGFILLYLFSSKYDIKYFSRIFQRLNFEDNISLYFRVAAPLNNLKELITKNTHLLFFGLGNRQRLVADNNIVVLIYQYGVIYTIVYFFTFIKYSIRDIKKYLPILMIFLLTNILFSGMGQFATFFFTAFYSCAIYDRNTIDL